MLPLLLLDTDQVVELAKELYEKCYLITPYSSQFFTHADIVSEQARYEYYSLQGSSLAVRLSDIVWDDNRPVGYWFDNTTKRNIIMHVYGSSTIDENSNEIATVSIPDGKLDQELELILENEEQDSNRLEHNPLVGLLHAIVTRSNWQLLSVGDKDKLLYVYGVISELEASGTVELDYDQSLDKLLRLQFLPALEISILDPKTTNFAIGRGRINLVHNVLELVRLQQ